MANNYSCLHSMAPKENNIQPPKKLYCSANQKEQMCFDACGFSWMEKPTSEQCVHVDRRCACYSVSYHIGIILSDVFKDISG